MWGTLIVLPYMLTRGVLPIASRGLLTAEHLQAAFLWGWLAEAGLLAGYLLSAHEQRIVAVLQSMLHVDKTLVSRELRSHSGGSRGYAQRSYGQQSGNAPQTEQASAAMEEVLQELKSVLHTRAARLQVSGQT